MIISATIFRPPYTVALGFEPTSIELHQTGTFEPQLYILLLLFQLFTSLLNIVCSYDPAGILPYNHLLFADTREETVEAALQVRARGLDPGIRGSTLPNQGLAADCLVFYPI